MKPSKARKAWSCTKIHTKTQREKSFTHAVSGYKGLY